MCCGHGLTGILFAMFERGVQRVDLVDRKMPTTHRRIMDAAHEVAPWVKSKVQFHPYSVGQYTIPPEAAIIGVHACGSRTDQCLDRAIAHRLPVGVMPCCHSPTSYRQRTRPFDESVGVCVAIDIDRTYHLQSEGYRVEWLAIPRAITEKNRIILAIPTSNAGDGEMS